MGYYPKYYLLVFEVLAAALAALLAALAAVFAALAAVFAALAAVFAALAAVLAAVFATLVVVVVFDTLVALVLARLAFELEAVLVLAASPQAIPRALRPRTAESTTFFIMENSHVFSKVKLA